MRKFDKNDIDKLNAKEWQTNLLNLNPDYCWWGPYEDYMASKETGNSAGWNSRLHMNSWKDLDISLDDLNEVVNFYFEIDRETKPCIHCAGAGYHPDAQWVSESFYRHSTPFQPEDKNSIMAKKLLESFGSRSDQKVVSAGSFPSEKLINKYKPEFREFCEAMRRGDGCWHDKITDDEVAALQEEGRIREEKIPTAEEINGIQSQPGQALRSHDAINRGILVEARLKRFGIPKYCDNCTGDGTVFTAPEAHVNLILWLIHPRKGASRGIEIKNIQEEDLPSIFIFLKQAAERNAQRFAEVVKLAK